MKAMMMSIRSPHACNILNLIKLWEIRKRFPKDYVGWVYIYCTKGNKNECLIVDLQPDKVYHPLTEKLHRGVYSIVEEKAIWNDCKKYILNGKVVARFWCDKVEDYVYGHKWSWESGAPMWGADNSYEKILKDMCLTDEELRNYVDDLCFSAIHITKLEIFDKPKEISELQGTCNKSCEANRLNVCNIKPNCNRPLTRAPQSWCYVEV